MKRIVNVSAWEFSTKWPSYRYVSKADYFGVKSTIMTQDIRLIFDRYTLQLEGSEEDIQMFLDYLKCEGFKIKNP